MDGAGVVAAVGVVIGHFLEEEGGEGVSFLDVLDLRV